MKCKGAGRRERLNMMKYRVCDSVSRHELNLHGSRPLAPEE